MTDIFGNVGSFGQLQTAFARTLAVVLYMEVFRHKHTIAFFYRSHTGQRCLYNPVLEVERAELEWREER